MDGVEIQRDRKDDGGSAVKARVLRTTAVSWQLASHSDGPFLFEHPQRQVTGQLPRPKGRGLEPNGFKPG